MKTITQYASQDLLCVCVSVFGEICNIIVGNSMSLWVDICIFLFFLLKDICNFCIKICPVVQVFLPCFANISFVVFPVLWFSLVLLSATLTTRSKGLPMTITYYIEASVTIYLFLSSWGCWDDKFFEYICN